MENRGQEQNNRNYGEEYRGKLTAVIALTVILIALILGGLVKVIADEKKIKEREENRVTEEVTPPAEENTQGESEANGEETEETQVTPVPVDVPKIAIDAGHGGDSDRGTSWAGLKEKDANLAIARYLREILADMGYEICMIREDDTGVELQDRPAYAMANGADLYISIHQNAIETENDATRGCEVWYVETRNDGSDVLAQYVVDALAAATGTRNRGIKVNNDLVVLKNCEVPACLVECGFMSSETERNNLFTPEYQKKVAQGIAEGIAQFLPLEQ